MSDKTQLGSRIAKEAKAMLAEMATEDLRTLSTELEVLIREEYARRNERQRREAIVNPHYPDAAPARELVDTPIEYVTEKERT